MSYIKKYNIYVIFFFIFCLRLFGADYGLPFFLVSDEEVVVGSALKMLQLKSIFPILYEEEMKMLIYPPFLPIITLVGILPFFLFLYIKNGFPEISEFNNICLNNIEFFFLGARISNIFFNLLIMILIYKICCLLFNSKRIATFSIIFLATDFTFNLTGHFVRHWNLTTLLIWITIFFTLKLYYSNNFKNYFYASISSGIGFGTSYVFGGFGFLFLAILHFLKNKIRNLKKITFGLIIFLSISLISIIMHPNSFLRLIVKNETNVTALYLNRNFLNTIHYYLECMFLLNPVLVLITIFSVFYCFYKKLFLSKIFLFFLIFIMFIVLLHLTVQNEHRYLMPVIPCLAIISSIGLNEILKNKKYSFQIFIVIFLLSYSFIVSFYSSYLLSQKDTRIQALEWIKNNAESNSKIANGMKNININKMSKQSKAKNTVKNNLIGMNKYNLREKFSFINISDSFINTKSNSNLLEFLISNKFDYVLIDYKYKENKHYRISKDFYSELNNSFFIEKKIESSFSFLSTPDLQSTEGFKFPIYKIFKFNSFGPTVEIYKFKG